MKGAHREPYGIFFLCKAFELFDCWCSSVKLNVSLSIVLVENVPDDLSFSADGRPHLPLSAGFNTLLDQAKHSVEVVSSVWDLNSWDLETIPNTTKQVQSRGSQNDEPNALPMCSTRANAIIFLVNLYVAF